jgi:hypothetical protein
LYHHDRLNLSNLNPIWEDLHKWHVQ